VVVGVVDVVVEVVEVEAVEVAVEAVEVAVEVVEVAVGVVEVVTRGVILIVHEAFAGVRSVMLLALIARTSNVCGPAANAW
jgi:hypothetical protein